MLAAELIERPFRFGLSEDMDPFQAPPGVLLEALNAEWVKANRLQKRDGVSQHDTTGASFTSAARLFTRGSELCITDGTKLYVKQGAEWALIDTIPNVGMTWTTALDTTTGVQCADSVLSDDGYLVTAWTVGDPTLAAPGGGVLYAQVTDVASGSYLMTPTLVDSSSVSNLRVVVSGTTAVIVYKSGADIVGQVVNLTTMGLGSLSILKADSGNRSLDACVIGSSFVVAYSTAASTDIFSLTTGLVAGANVVVQATDSLRVSVDGNSGDFLYVLYATGASVARVAVCNPGTLAVTSGPTDVETLAATPPQLAICRLSSSTAVAVYTASPTGSSRVTTSVLVTSGAAVTTATTRGTWSTLLQSKPVVFGGRVYAVLCDYAGSFYDAFRGVETYLVEIETDDVSLAGNYPPHRYVGKIDVLLGGRTALANLPQFSLSSSTSAFGLVPYLATAPTTSDSWRVGMRLVNLTLGSSVPADMWRGVSFGAETYLPAGVLTVYDGRAVFDYAGARAPVFATYNATSPAGAIETGDYIYGVHRSFRSAAGVLHRGPTATAEALGLTDPSEVIWTFTHVNVGNRFRGGGSLPSTLDSAYREYVTVHRSVANGVNLHRLSVEPTYNVVQIDPLAVSQSFTDERSNDAIDGSALELEQQSLMYTAGDVLDDHQPPSLVTLLLHQSRLWGLAGDLRTIWFSKSFNDDLGVAPGFHPDFRIVLDKTVTALGSMDEKLIIFAADSFWYVLGQGPAPNGDDSDLTNPTSVQSDVGCTNPRSVVSMPDGIMFQAESGLYLLTRALEVVWIGRPIQDQLDAFPNITSAVLVPKKGQVRFTCNDDAGTAHVVLVYDYQEKQWSTFEYLGGAVAIADAVIHDGAYTFATTDGAIYYEDAETHLDDGTWVSFAVETAWISASGLTGFQRARRAYVFGTRLTDCDVSMSVAVDGADAFDQTLEWVSDELSDAQGGKFGVHIRRQKCHSLRVRIEDATPTGAGASVGTGQGLTLSALGLEIAKKQGLDKRGAQARK